MHWDRLLVLLYITCEKRVVVVSLTCMVLEMLIFTVNTSLIQTLTDVLYLTRLIDGLGSFTYT